MKTNLPIPSPKNNTTKSSDVAKDSDATANDNDADKTGSDKNADATDKTQTDPKLADHKFDKPKREPNPDPTKTKEQSDKTKKEK